VRKLTQHEQIALAFLAAIVLLSALFWFFVK
jgi:hypothetical protein